jgi:hypothetical protein
MRPPSKVRLRAADTMGVMAGEQPAAGISMEIPIDWSAADEVTAAFANQVLIQSAGDEIYIAFGQVTPPVVTGTPEEQRAKAGSIDTVQVKVVARVAMSPARLRELFDALATSLASRAPQDGGDESGSSEPPASV